MASDSILQFSIWKFIVLVLGGYLIGSIPWGVIIGWLWKGVDIRKYGSGNIGATNTLRVLGIGPAIAVFIADALKGAVAAYLGKWLAASALPGEGILFQRNILGLLGGTSAVIGHNWPVYLKFKGGRGVATACGAALIIFPREILIAFAIWLAVVALTRYISLGSMIAAISAPFILLAFHNHPVYVLFTAVLAALVVYRHRPNIGRLLAGRESKLGERVPLTKELPPRDGPRP